jgi:outer membrane protein OmpA-like peptidoglycan-associated protein
MVSGATMVSEDQVGRMGYNHFGLLSDVQLGFAVRPWLELNLGLLAGGFPSPHKLGGLVVPLGGVIVTGTDAELRPYAQLDIGPGFTGTLMRVYWRAAVGIELRASSTLSIGPRLGYGHLFQTHDPGDSTDARFLWMGFAMSFRPAAVQQHTTELVTHRVVYTRRTLPDEPRPDAPAQPRAPPAKTSTDELMELIERTLPSHRVEILAPVLFKFDSDVLEPIGVAMLHEVEHELSQRTDIELMEIQGYADSRGTPEYNQALSSRRAARVLDWLVEHGIAQQRLTVAAQGASAFVEPGSDERAHEQNRRVVFRVLKLVEK